MKKIIFLAIIIIFTACNRINPPYTENTGNCGKDDLSIPIKKVLVEDYTGHLCGNCPKAHSTLAQIKQKYCDHIVPVSIHAGFFAKPVAGDYSTDFRTETGDELNDYFGNDAAGLPNGMVNRTPYNNTLILSYAAWENAVYEQLTTPPEIDVQVTGATLDQSTNQISVSVQVRFLKNLDANLMLNVWLTEDSIIDFQKDYDANPQDIPDYVHNHVLRYSATGTWGIQILNSTASQNQIIEKQFTIAADTTWNIKHCNIVSFVSDKNTLQIYQAEEEKIF